MSKVFYRNPHQEYPRGLRGEGVYLYDTDGKQYLDGSGGAAVSCVGHLHPYVISAIKRQIDQQRMKLVKSRKQRVTLLVCHHRLANRFRQP